MAEKLSLIIAAGRGGTGKSFGLAEIAQRGMAHGRSVLVADGDYRSKSLGVWVKDAMKIPAEDIPTSLKWMSSVFNSMARGKMSAVMDLGTNDRLLLEYSKDLDIVTLCHRLNITPVMLYYLGPDIEDLGHAFAIYQSECFRPEHAFIVLNEGVMRSGSTVRESFGKIMSDERFTEMTKNGITNSMFMNRLGQLATPYVESNGGNFYDAANNVSDDFIAAMMVQEWLKKIELERETIGLAGLLP